jgi:uncharacterized protein YkwD
MKKLVCLFLLLLAGCSNVVTSPPSQVMFTAQLVDAHNQFREAHGKQALSLDPELQQACAEHAFDMAKSQRMSHKGSDGSTPFSRITKYGYVWGQAGENIARNQKTVASVMTGWETSPGHLENMLTDEYTNIGAACVYDVSGHPYWCVDFATPLPK